jgi:hypothetical protein
VERSRKPGHGGVAVRDSVRKAIERAYPTGVYSERDASVLDREVKIGKVLAFVEQLRALKAGEVKVEVDKNHDVCWRIEIATLELARLSRGKARGKMRVTLYRTFVLISRLGPFYCIYWNVFPHPRQPELVWTPPTPVAELAKWIAEKLKKFRIERLSHEELWEVVPWVLPGDSIMAEAGEPVTVYRCLFSEI